MIRVLHLYAGNLYGGVEAMLATLARSAHAGGLEHHFGLAWADGRLGDELRTVCPARVHALGAARLRNPLAVRRARAALRTLLASARPQVVICHSAWAQALWGPVVRRARLPLVFWLHDAAGRTAPERLAARTRPDAAVGTSRFVRDTLPRLYPGLEGTVIHPAVAPPAPGAADGRAALRERLGASPDQVVFLQMARMEPWKGHAVLLEALAGLPRDGWRCWMVGGAQRPAEAAYRAGLEARAAGLGLSGRVDWLGERRDPAALMAAADVCVQPNASPEPFGMAMVEALYAGRPVVAADQGGAREVVDERCGLRFAPGDAHALRTALERLLADPALRARLGEAGPARAARLCDPAARSAELAALLRPLVDRRAA